MRGTVARALRRDIYGDYSPRFRKHSTARTTQARGDGSFVTTGYCVVADPRRRAYQKAKKLRKEGE